MTLLALILSSASCINIPAVVCDAAAQTSLDPHLIYAVALVESKGNMTAYKAQDGKSASYGIMQIKLRTAQGLGFKGSKQDLMHPAVNTLYAAKYLNQHLKKYKNLRKAISAYNAGRPINSNAHYVNAVLTQFNQLKGNK